VGEKGDSGDGRVFKTRQVVSLVSGFVAARTGAEGSQAEACGHRRAGWVVGFVAAIFRLRGVGGNLAG